ncbi:MAG: ketopantoate reductase family protein [Candidatus Hermodarchaeia archaeon]|jgi:2-dehydropantoate 2-reductase
MTFSHIVVLGAGAIGSIYGALLSQKHDVTLIGRPAHMKAIRERGLVVTGDAAGTYKMKTATKVEDILPQTLLMVTVKAHQLHEVLTSIRQLLRKDTIILLLQNGLGIKETAHSALGSDSNIIRGIVAFGAEFLEPGQIHVRLGFTFLDSDTASLKVTELFQKSGLDVDNSEEFSTEVWRKVAINCVANPLSAILQIPTKKLVSPELENIRRGVVEECIAVGQAEGIKLDLSLLQKMETQFPNFENRTSMFQDILRGRKTEIKFLNGWIVELGRRHKIPTPVNEVLTQLIRFMEAEMQ